MRMTGYAPPTICWMLAMVRPAAMVTRMNRVFRAASRGPICVKSPSIIWGFTPRKIKSALSAMALLSVTRQPSSSASALAFSKVWLARKISSGSAVRQTARASAPPILPTPMNP